jgi:hypothetical protein
MACCAPATFPFNNVASSTIAYTPAMQAIYGTTPRVFVLYRDMVTGEYLVSSFFTVIEYTPGQIFVDHGGPQYGIVVVS